jgi:hypothetical protein
MVEKALKKDISDSELSAYSTTRGLYVRCNYNDTLKLFPVISKHNPQAKLMILLENLSFEDAIHLLEIGYKIYKMLQIGIFF